LQRLPIPMSEKLGPSPHAWCGSVSSRRTASFSPVDPISRKKDAVAARARGDKRRANRGALPRPSWDRDPRLAELGWEPPVKIRRRNYRRRRPLEKFKAALRNFGIAALRGSAAIDRRAAGAWRRATRMISIPERRRVEAAAIPRTWRHAAPGATPSSPRRPISVVLHN
jgi:hypothetical protein